MLYKPVAVVKRIVDVFIFYPKNIYFFSLQLLEKHKITENMVELLELYQMEDEAFCAVVEATTEFYQYLLQPFRDMRELAMLRRQQIKVLYMFLHFFSRSANCYLSVPKTDTLWLR